MDKIVISNFKHKEVTFILLQMACQKKRSYNLLKKYKLLYIYIYRVLIIHFENILNIYLKYIYNMLEICNYFITY